MLPSLFGSSSMAATGHRTAQTMFVLEKRRKGKSRREGAYQLKQLKHTQSAHVAVKRDGERERVRSNCSTNSTRDASRRATIGDV